MSTTTVKMLPGQNNKEDFLINKWEIAVLVLFCFFVPVLICIVSVLETSVPWRCDKQLPDVSFFFYSFFRGYLNVQNAPSFLKVWL